jgi:transcriptional regulator with XRE-family HTH domain
MARRTRSAARQWTGLYYARQARGMSRTELVKRSGVSKQQLSRLENGLIRLRLDHLKPFASHLGYTPEQILLWGRYPGTGGHTDTHDRSVDATTELVPELDTRADHVRKEGRHTDAMKAEGWLFPTSFVHEQLHTSSNRLLVVEINSDSMAPTIRAGERVIVDTGHKTPTPDGLYAIRDTFESVVVKRLQVMRSTKPTRVKIISDNTNHASEEAPLSDIEVVGKILCCLKPI